MRTLVAVAALIGLVVAVPVEDKWNPTPIRSVYGNEDEPGARPLPDYLKEEEMPPGTHLPERPTNNYMSDPSVTMPEHSVPYIPPVFGSLSPSEIAAYEEVISKLLKQRNALQHRRDETFMGISRPHLGVTLRLTFPPSLSDGELSEIISAVAAIGGVEKDDVMVLAEPDNHASVRIAVFPSEDFTLESDAIKIAHNLDAGLKSGRFTRALKDKGIPWKHHEITVNDPPTVVGLQHYVVVTSLVVNVDSSLLNLDYEWPLRIAIANITKVLEGDVETNVVRDDGNELTLEVRIHVMNTTYIPRPAEAVGDAFAAKCDEIAPSADRAARELYKENIATTPLYETRLCGQSIHVQKEAPPVYQTHMAHECYGRGRLLSNGTCECSEYWKDADCSTKRCPVGWTHEAGNLPHLECSGQGHCADPYGACVCEEGYGGFDCSSVLKCSPGQLEQCTGHGSCTPDDAFPHVKYTCKCFAGWTGDQCHIPVEGPPTCPTGIGKIDNHWAFVPCSGRGDCACEGVEGCKCHCTALGWNGTACHRRECPYDCSGHGTCIDGECVCERPWSGAACDAQAACGNGCHGRGECVHGECQCREGFEGAQCELDNCENSHSNRRVVSVSVVSGMIPQAVAWHLDSSETRAASKHPWTPRESQFCLTTGTHTLTAHVAHNTTQGWHGGAFTVRYGISGALDTAPGSYRPSEEQVLVPMVNVTANRTRTYSFVVETDCAGEPMCAGHGTCLGGHCCCHSGWQGDLCDEPVLAVPNHTLCEGCPAGHVCDDQQRCVCTREMERAGVCEADACPVAHSACGVCAGHGDCLNGRCVCDVDVTQAHGGAEGEIAVQGWYGDACETAIYCPHGCNSVAGQGHCDLTAGKCVCETGFSGDGCERGECPGTPACSDHGTCSLDGTCVCAPGYGGLACDAKVCAGGCYSGACVEGECVCAPLWSGRHCEQHSRCPTGMVFNNCSDGCVRTCASPECEASAECVPSCQCPPDRPVYDEATQMCVPITQCSDTCFSSLNPLPTEVEISVTPTTTSGPAGSDSSRAYVCAHRPLKVCYKAGHALLDPSSETGLVAHSRAYHAPISLVVYDDHNQRVAQDWARQKLEDNGRTMSLYGAPEGFAMMQVNKFGPMEIRYYAVGPSSTAPRLLGSKRIFAHDCDVSDAPLVTPPACAPASAPEHGSIDCNGNRAGATCEYTCDAGLLLSNPENKYIVCNGHSGWSAKAPTCLGFDETHSCAHRGDGELCTMSDGHGGVTTGKCHATQCQPHDRRCAYVCDPATSKCEVKCSFGEPQGKFEVDHSAHLAPLQTDHGKVKGYVAAVANQLDVLEQFESWWSHAWEGLPLERVGAQGTNMHDTFANAVAQAVTDQVDFAVFLTPAARPFEKAVFPADLLSALDASPANLGVLLLGAHNVVPKQGQPLPQDIAKLGGGVIHVERANGFHAFVLPRHSLTRLQQLWKSEANQKDDTAWWKLWDASAPAVVMTPLAVDYSPAWAPTWQKDGVTTWMGHSDWWNFA